MAESASHSALSPSRLLSLESHPPLDDEEVNEHAKGPADEEDEEECIRNLFDKERGIKSNPPVDDWIKLARSEAIQWIINTRALFRFRFHTAYLSVTYIDRFLSKGLIDGDKRWAIRLLSAASLSLAVKMEERKIPAWSDFLIEDYSFESKFIRKMELMVLSELEWRMRPITPFDFIRFFISRFCQDSSKRKLVAITIQILVASTKDTTLMGHRSSALAMAASLMAMDQKLTRQSLETKMGGISLNPFFDIEDVHSCYRRMLELKVEKVKLSKLIANPDLVNCFEVSSVTSAGNTKRKRLTFNDDNYKSREKKPPR